MFGFELSLVRLIFFYLHIKPVSTVPRICMGSNLILIISLPCYKVSGLYELTLYEHLFII